MKSIFIVFFLLSFTGKLYSQRTAESAYNLFSQIDWSIWRNMDTIKCTTNRLDYTENFDSLFVTGISRDTIEKYLGKGIDINADHWHGNVKSKKVQDEIFYYNLTWSCRFHGGERRLIITYKKGKLDKYNTRHLIIFD